MDKPAWIERILSDTQSYRSFMETIEQNETSLLQEMRHCLENNDLDKARILAGESIAWKKVRHQLTMYEREEEQHGIIQEGRPTG